LAYLQQIQLQDLSPLFFQSTSVQNIYKHLQGLATKSNMELLISATSDLFQVDVSYYYKSVSQEINNFIHLPKLRPVKLLKLYQCIKFPLSQSIEKLTMMPNFKEDLRAVGQDQQFKL
jgi:hypothetical protein